MRVISIVSGKGGVGKTTIASNLGAVLAGVFGKNVLVVDCNITTAHLGLYLGMDNLPVTLNHVLRGSANASEAIYSHPTGMKVLPASISLRDMDGVDMFRLKDVVRELRETHAGIDYVLLDCAPGLGREAMSAIKSSSEMLFVSIPYMPALMDVVKCGHSVRGEGIKTTGLVLNMVSKAKHEVSEKEAERIVSLPVLASISHDAEVLRSLASRMPVVVYNANSKAGRGMVSLAGRLVRLYDG